MKYYVYADCASYRNGKENQIGGFCALILDQDHNEVHRIVKAFKGTTNNFNELAGVLVGIEYVLKELDYTNIEVVSDSQYVIKGANEWLHNWVKKGWKTTSGPVKNKELWETMLNFINHVANSRKVLEFTWTKGHKGKSVSKEEDIVTYYQELCDTIATEYLSKAVALNK